MAMTKKDVLKLAEEQNVQFVNCQFTDIIGTLKAVTIPVWKLEDAIDQNVWFDGSSIEGFTRIHESDMFLKLDLDTFAVIPWTKGSTSGTRARIICDVYMPDGTKLRAHSGIGHGCPQNRCGVASATHGGPR